MLIDEVSDQTCMRSFSGSMHRIFKNFKTEKALFVSSILSGP